MSLKKYLSKRNLKLSGEPRAKISKKKQSGLQFVIQKHQATRLHYDFRLEVDGVLKSWAIPKGPSLDPNVKRLAIQVEDHPLEYRNFEGVIARGYGAGTVMIWDRGTYSTDTLTKESSEKAIREGLKKGAIHFSLQGEKLHGHFSLIRLKGDENQWLFIKHNDAFASQDDVTELDTSVVSSKDLNEIASAQKVQLKTKRKKIEKRPPLKPMLATLIEAPFDNEEWYFEIKLDGFRAIANLEGDRVNLVSRNEISFNKRFPHLADELGQLKLNAILDGEIVALNNEGISDFQVLQNASDSNSIYFYVFDILYLNGKNLCDLPLHERKAILRSVLKDHKHIRVLDHIEGKGRSFFKKCREAGCEGIIGKNKQSPYRTGLRSKEWVKIKAVKQQEVIICGFTEPRRSRKHFGSLITGVYRKGKLEFAGHVGGGFTESKLDEVVQILKPLASNKCPFKIPPKTNRGVVWVKPQLLCEVKFSEWTKDGLMRHPIFLGLRADKSAQSVIEEQELPVRQVFDKSKSPAKKYDFLTHLDKLYWPKEKITKGDIILYYEAMAPYIMPYLQDRPQVLKRFPNGIDKPSFFQKNLTSYPEWISTLSIEHHGKMVNYLVIDDVESLLYAVNLGCIELHPWSSRYTAIDNPDFLILDLDPENISFNKTIEVAHLLHTLLDELGVPNFCKTSGSRGLHIIVPTGLHYSYEQIKLFAQLIALKAWQIRPDIISLKRSPSKRQKKVYIDYLQNNFGQTIIAPYSVRAKPKAPVSTPLQWHELDRNLSITDFNLFNTLARLKRGPDPFKPVLKGSFDMKRALYKLNHLK